MTSKTRFLTGSLASLAVASAVTLAAPSANAADAPDHPCGQPAVPAVYLTVIHEPELRVVPAVTHDEWLWERDLTSYEYEYTRVVTLAHSESDWTRDVPGSTEYQWSLKVVDQPAVPGTPEQGHHATVVVTPAVTVTQFEYVQHQTGKTRWERDGWNGQHGDEDDGKGWAKTGNTREETVTPEVTEDEWVVDQPATPAVDEVSHLEYTWAESSPGAGWTGPLDTRVVGGGTESTTTTGDDVPTGDGWTRTQTHDFPAVVDTLWAQDAPGGYDPTGASRVHDVATEQTDSTSATTPAGDGWSQVDGSRVVVVDQPETTELVGEGFSEQVLVSPEVPASEPCVESPAGPDDDGDETPTGSVAGPQAGGSAVVSGVQASGGSHAATVLPATGNPISPALLTAGLGAVLAGGVLVRVARRRPTS